MPICLSVLVNFCHIKEFYSGKMKQKVINQFRVTIETRVKKLKLKFKVCPTFVHIGTEILKKIKIKILWILPLLYKKDKLALYV